MIRKGFHQRVLAIFCKSIIVLRCQITSDNLVAIVPELKCNQDYSDVDFAVDLTEIILTYLNTFKGRCHELYFKK